MRPCAMARGAAAPLPPTVLGADAGSACVAGALAVAVVVRAVRRLPFAGARARAGRPLALGGCRSSKVARCAEKEAEFDVPGIGHRGVNSVRASGGAGARGNWMMPGNELPEDDFGAPQPKPPKSFRAPPRAPGYAVWSAKRKELPSLLGAWAEAADSEERRAFLQALLEEEIPQGWAVWALAEASAATGGGGFFLSAPREPQALVFLEPQENSVNSIQHVALSPKEASASVRKCVQEWIESLKPKKVIIARPDELNMFGLEVLAGGARISKGL